MKLGKQDRAEVVVASSLPFASLCDDFAFFAVRILFHRKLREELAKVRKVKQSRSGKLIQVFGSSESVSDGRCSDIESRTARDHQLRGDR